MIFVLVFLTQNTKKSKHDALLALCLDLAGEEYKNLRCFEIKPARIERLSLHIE